MEEIQKKYKICKFKSKTGKQKKLLLEEIDTTLYKPSAHCVAFYTTEERILYWVKALHDHYFEPLSENNHYHVAWIDRYNDDETAFEHIELKVSHVNGERQSLQGHPTSLFGKYLFGRRFEI